MILSERIKSLIRHLLTFLGGLLMALGFGNYADAIAFVGENLDMVVNAVTVIIGFVSSLIGYFSSSDRHEIVEQFRVAQLKKVG